MKPQQLIYLLIGVGLTLIVASFLLPKVVGGKRAWTEEDARAYTEAGANLHDAVHKQTHELGHDGAAHEHDHAAEDGSQTVPLKEAEEKFAEQKAKLEAAQNRGRFTGRVLLGLGVICSGIGVVMFFVQGKAG